LAALIAAYVVYHVKSYVAGCGMDTHVTMLKGGRASYLSEEMIDSLEHQFSSYMAFDVQAVHFLIGRGLMRKTRLSRHTLEAVRSGKRVRQTTIQRVRDALRN